MHPRERHDPNMITRRKLLQLAGAAGVSIPSASALLAACGKSPKATEGQKSLLGRPDSPVELPIHEDVQPIEDGLPVEEGATLQLFNWAEYIAPKVVKTFCEKFNCDYEYTTFNNMAEAEQKIVSGQVADVIWPSAEILGRLVQGKYLQPLNQSYIPNIENTWTVFSDPGPWYDPGWRYTVPYECFPTGIGYRRDVVSDEEAAAQGYELLWNPDFSGRIGVLDVFRETIGTALLRSGITDVNTEKESDIAKAQAALEELVPHGVRIDINYYGNFGEKFQVHQGWGTDFVTYVRFYSPKEITPEDVGFWFPEDKGVAANDMMAVAANAPHPVLAHEFLNYMLDNETAYTNFAAYGYPAPLNSMTPESLIDQGDVPPHLADALVTEERWKNSYWIAELPPAAEQMYADAWQAFKLSSG